jgi:chitin biosynthesis protein CHS5
MNKDFKFPPSTSSELPVKKAPPPPLARESLVTGPDARKPNIITPSSVEVPPPPVNKKSTSTHSVDDVEEDVGPTEEISLN